MLVLGAERTEGVGHGIVRVCVEISWIGALLCHAFEEAHRTWRPSAELVLCVSLIRRGRALAS